MRVLVTGATGHIGRIVVEQLVTAGVRVRAMTRRPQQARFPEAVETIAGDLTDPAALASVLAGVDRMYLFPVARTAREVVTADPRVLADPAPFLGVGRIENAGIRLAVKPWVQVPDVISAESELYQALAERFRAEGIGVPPARHEIRMLEAASAR